MQNCAAGTDRLFLFGVCAGDTRVILALVFIEMFAHFSKTHRTVLELTHSERHHHDNGQNCVEVIGNGADEQLQAVGTVNKTGNSCCPGRDGRDDANGRGRSVDQICQLGARDTVPVCERTHDGANSEAVEIVVDKNENTECDGGQLRADFGLDVRRGPAAKRGRTAGPVHQDDHDAEDDEEDENADVIGIGQGGAHHAVDEDMLQGTNQIEVGKEQTADKNADEEGGIDLLRDECQRDGDDRRQKGEDGCIEVHTDTSFQKNAS